MSKKILVALAATAALALVGPAMASADTWYADSFPPATTALPSSGSYSDTLDLSGNLHFQAAGATISCWIDASLDIGNDTMGNAIQEVTDFQIHASPSAPCGTTINGGSCTVVGASTFLFPWLATDVGSSTLEVGDIYFLNTFDNANCGGLNGATIYGGTPAGLDGTLTTELYEPAQIFHFSWPGSGAISSSLGGMAVFGDLQILTGHGLAYDLR